MHLGILDKSLIEELQEELSQVLGEKINNTVLINRFITNICENSTPERGIAMSREFKEAMDVMNAFNLKNIYRCERVEYSDKFFDLVLGQIFSLLAGSFKGWDTLAELGKLAKYYPNMIARFTEWLIVYTDMKNTEINRNKTVFDISNEKEYKKAVITYMSGMTDKFAIDTYNEIISF